MQEKIGNVVLDETWYAGQDLYTDGEIEDTLLDIARSASEEDLNQEISRAKSWPVLYHFSHIRENIADSLPLTASDTVLEIGAGCGAVTGALARKAGSVTCVDLSRKRSMVNAWRHKDYGNVRILVGNYEEIEPHLTEKYDYITLIGVFEYASSYISGECPYAAFLEQIKSHLKEDGQLIIAIENRLGLKYWAGCREDHTGHLFEGLENYPDPSAHARTFSKPALEKLFADCGFSSVRFTYPYPDYKLPLEIYSDDYLPGTGDLRLNNWNYDRERLVLFDETAASDSMIRDGLYPLFANSFLIRLSVKEPEKGREICYSKFSNERARCFALRTDICREADGEMFVRKSACYPEGDHHIGRLKEAGEKLAALFADTPLSVNELIQKEETMPDGRSCACFAWLPGRQTLEQALLRLWQDGRREEALGVLRFLSSLLMKKADQPFAVTDEFARWFGKSTWPWQSASLALTDLDMVAENLMLTEEEHTGGSDLPADLKAVLGNHAWTLIDYEWTFDFPIPADYVVFRIWHYFFARNLPGLDAAPYLEAEGFSREKTECYLAMEERWQETVLQGHVPVRDLYSSISPGLRDPVVEMELPDRREENHYISTLRWGKSSDDPDMQQQEAPMQIDEEGRFSVRFSLRECEKAAYLRWDPTEGCACRIHIEKVLSQGLVLPVPVNGFRENGTDVFWTADPVYELQKKCTHLQDVLITGTWERIDLRGSLGGITQIQAERNAFENETAQLRSQITEITGTKAYRGVEVLRRIRNYIMARVRGSVFFRDRHAVSERYQQWLAEHSATPQELDMQRKVTLTREPVISILVPVYQTPENFLREMIASVQNQTWPHWELCIADGTPGESVPGRIIQELMTSDARIRYQHLTENRGIAENTNSAADLATGEYITLLDHDDLLAPDALFEAAQAICSQDPDVIYTDEDKVDMEGKWHFDPNLKPDFSPDLLRSHNYITHLFVVRKSLFEQVGRFNSKYDGAQDYDLIFRCCEKADRIVHIPKILYYWRCHPSSTAENPESKLYAYEAGRQAIEDHLQRAGVSARVERLPYWGLNHVIYDIPEDAFVSVIIPNKDHIGDLDRCIRSILDGSSFRRFEIVVVENNSTEEETFRYYEQLGTLSDQISVVHFKGAFNYSAVNNFGVRHAKGNYLLLLNNDTKLIAPESIGEMAGICSRSEVGCVGAKLLFENDTIQHAGIVLGYGGFAGHVFSGLPKDTYGFMMRPLMAGNYSAVTAACMMLRREVYEAVGGLDEKFAVALNDVDLCMRLRKAGYLIVYTPFSCWYHYESVSSGYEDTPEKKARFEREVKLFRADWAETVDAPDPYYNPNFSLKLTPFTLW